MNIQFCREISQANDLFQFLFNVDASTSMIIHDFEQDMIEQELKARAQRLHNFYREYADQ